MDAGVSGVRIANVLREIDVAPENICAILVTHEHSDHIKGAGIFSRKYNVPIYAKAKTWQAMRRELGKLSENNIKIINDNIFTLGDLLFAVILYRTMRQTRWRIHFRRATKRFP